MRPLPLALALALAPALALALALPRYGGVGLTIGNDEDDVIVLGAPLLYLLYSLYLLY